MPNTPLNGSLKKALEIIGIVATISFIIWRLNIAMIDEKISKVDAQREARVGPMETKIVLMEKQLDRIENKIDRLLEDEKRR